MGVYRGGTEVNYHLQRYSVDTEAQAIKEAGHEVGARADIPQ